MLSQESVQSVMVLPYHSPGENVSFALKNENFCSPERERSHFFGLSVQYLV